MEMMKQVLDMVSSDLDSAKDEMLLEARSAQYKLQLVIDDLKKNKEYRQNVPDQIISRLAQNYAAYSEKKRTFELVKIAFEKEIEELSKTKELSGDGISER